MLLRSTIRWLVDVTNITAVMFASLSCENVVNGRFKVISSEESPLSDALVRYQAPEPFEIARFTGDGGCAHWTGVVAPVAEVPVSIEMAGYRSLQLDVTTNEEHCFVVHLAREDTNGEGSVSRVAIEECPCASGTGYWPMMSARFKVTTTDGATLELVEAHRSGHPRFPSVQVTDTNGCLGLNWIVAADLRSVPLVLEKSGFRTASVDVPTMEDRCYSVVLSRVEETPSNIIVSVPTDECQCETFSGRSIWLEQYDQKRSN